MKYQYKLALIIFSFFTLSLLYVRYEISIYEWFCENEGNGAACFVASNLYNEHQMKTLANEYLQKSCKLKYSLACEKIKGPEPQKQ
ncbi:hypothetical protein [Halobacteriovorax sp. HLS]|uniref:hypothetical protein n=1 Tax=Halobacteriovorax sp. HLS TaxID=2234000 RepID=UPI000FD94FA0|nr:hypothetical protein [Halobacteriovorax sp. HLS]